MFEGISLGTDTCIKSRSRFGRHDHRLLEEAEEEELEAQALKSQAWEPQVEALLAALALEAGGQAGGQGRESADVVSVLLLPHVPRGTHRVLLRVGRDFHGLVELCVLLC